MAMSYIWSGLVILSFLWGFFHGNLSAVAAAALDGAQSALELSLSMAGILCLWSGVMVCPAASPHCSVRCYAACCPTPAGTRKRWRQSPPMSPRTFWALATPPRRWASKPPGGWPETAAAPPVTSCACWWCSTPPPSSFCPPPWPPSGLPSAVPPPSTFCPPSGSVLSPLSRWACSPPAFSPAGKEALHGPL